MTIIQILYMHYITTIISTELSDVKALKTNLNYI